MVASHELSAKLVITLEKDLNAYQKQCRDRVGSLATGSQLPRTRYGWLIKHYRDSMKRRPNPIMKAIEDFNRSRDKPVTEPVFKNDIQYAKCLAPLEINEFGMVVYRAASDPVWGGKIKR